MRGVEAFRDFLKDFGRLSMEDLDCCWLSHNDRAGRPHNNVALPFLQRLSTATQIEGFAAALTEYCVFPHMGMEPGSDIFDDLTFSDVVGDCAAARATRCRSESVCEGARNE